MNKVKFIRVNDRQTRQRLIDDLRARGFTLDPMEQRPIPELKLPLTVDWDRKTYGAMGNITCAAAAATSGALMTVDEFYARYMGPEARQEPN